MNLKNDIDEIKKLHFVVDYGKQRETWQVVLSDKAINSCYLQSALIGEVKISGQEKPITLGYIRSGSGFVLETKPGICDGGLELHVTLSENKYIGLVQLRSISGYKQIGTILSRR